MNPQIYPAGVIDKATRSGPPQMVPFGPDNNNYFIVQEVTQDSREWEPLAFGTPYRLGGDSRPSYYLVDESQARYEGYKRTWDRTYMRVFDPYYELEQMVIHDMPGLAGEAGATAVKSFTRDTQSVSLPTKIIHTFFHLGISRADDGTGTLIESIDQIPQWNRLPIFAGGSWQNTYSGAEATALTGYYDRPAWFPDANSGSTLTEADYWDLKVLTHSWMVFGDVRLERVKGNLFVRKVRYFVAQ